MGANSETFLHLRDAEVNGEGYSAPSPVFNELDYTSFYHYKGKIVKEVGSRGNRIFCVYPGSDKTYTFWKSDLIEIRDREEKIQTFKLWIK